MKKDEKGYIVVETVGIFIPFTLLLLAVVMLINVVTLQSKVQHALTNTAKTISIMTYLTTKPENAVSGLSNFTSSFNNIFSVSNTLEYDQINWLKHVHEWKIEDFEEIFNYFMWVKEDANSLQGLIGGYGAFDFQFSKVTDESVILTVEYKIDYTFMGIIQPIAAMKVTQTAATGAWKNGDGKNREYWRSGD